jgi:hypothetical protein
MSDAVEMAVWLKKWGYMPEQVQDFYPTPGTISTVMYYTGIHPMTGKKVYVSTDYHEKKLQRALLQYSKPENANLVREALTLAGREDLIGTSPECLVRPESFRSANAHYVKDKRRTTSQSTRGGRGNGKNVKNTSHSPKSGDRNPSPRAKFGKDATVSSKKLDRVFGADASRIRREADRLSRPVTKSQGGTKKAKKTRRM